LKELGKTKHAGTVYKKVNEKLLAKKAPVEKPVTTKAAKNVKYASPIGSTQNTIPDPYKGN
jgi:hypothetical protein